MSNSMLIFCAVLESLLCLFDQCSDVGFREVWLVHHKSACGETLSTQSLFMYLGRGSGLFLLLWACFYGGEDQAVVSAP